MAKIGTQKNALKQRRSWTFRVQALKWTIARPTCIPVPLMKLHLSRWWLRSVYG